MRVIGGEWRGRRLQAPAGRATRPTSDRVREAVFDAVEALVVRDELGAAQTAAEDAAGPLAGLVVLDLFAGSGALGIEALSRGAARCDFVERAAPARGLLQANLAAVAAGEERFSVDGRDFRAALQAGAAGGRLYNLVFVDAPYALYPAFEPDLARLLGGVFAPLGLLVVETARGAAVTLPFEERSARLYGDTQVTFMTGR
jgi:16S rRNA (guanine966-N2)-methyltransferase